MFQAAVIIPAAGQSKRFTTGSAPPGHASVATSGGGGGLSKIEQDLAGKPVFMRALELFIKRPDVVQTILAVNPSNLEKFRGRWGETLNFMGVTIVPGGTVERWETVLKALEAILPGAGITHVVVHDAARPLSSPALIQRVFEAAHKYSAVIPGVPEPATLKKVQPLEKQQGAVDPLDQLLGTASHGPVYQRVTGQVDRRNVIEVQTPQIFEINLLRRAYSQITDGKISGQGVTDDAGLVEALGETVVVVEGESTNFKITRPEDLELAQALVQSRTSKQAASLAKKRLFADEDD